MTSRNAFVRLAAFTLGAGLVWAAQGQSLDFVHITDTHVASIDGVHPDILTTLSSKRQAGDNLAAALRNIGGGSRPAFVLATGDLLEGYQFEGASGQTVRGQIEAFRALVRLSPVPLMPVLGNHDITGYRPGGEKKAVGDQVVAPDARRAWAAALPPFQEGTYYSFERAVGRTRYLFVVLDDGESPTHGPAFAAAQLDWLKRQLASNGAGPVIVALHVPLALPGQKQAITQGIQEALATSRRVTLTIAGHRHSDAVETVELGERTVTQVRTAALFLGENNWRRFRLLEDRIEVFTTGKPRELAATVALQMAAAAGR
jgi:3',5'-cyclic AMP phosphodiesterase CpdA